MEEWKVDKDQVGVLQERVSDAGRVAMGMMKEEGYKVKNEETEDIGIRKKGFRGRGRGGRGRGNGRVNKK
jgi:hypothetical protein